MCSRGEPRNFICLAAVSRGIYQIRRGICQILPRKLWALFMININNPLLTKHNTKLNNVRSYLLQIQKYGQVLQSINWAMRTIHTYVMQELKTRGLSLPSY